MGQRKKSKGKSEKNNVVNDRKKASKEIKGHKERVDTNS